MDCAPQRLGAALAGQTIAGKCEAPAAMDVIGSSPVRKINQNVRHGALTAASTPTVDAEPKGSCLSGPAWGRDRQTQQRNRELSARVQLHLSTSSVNGVGLRGRTPTSKAETLYFRGFPATVRFPPAIMKPQPFSVGVFSCPIAPVPACSRDSCGSLRTSQLTLSARFRPHSTLSPGHSSLRPRPLKPARSPQRP